MGSKTTGKAKRGADRYYQPSLRPWGDDDFLVLVDLMFDGHEPAAIARILNRYLHDVLRAMRSPRIEEVQRWLITARYAARYPW